MDKKMTAENTKQTSLRLPLELYQNIEILGQMHERKPAEQIRYMLKKYVEMAFADNPPVRMKDSKEEAKEKAEARKRKEYNEAMLECLLEERQKIEDLIEQAMTGEL